VFNGDNLLMIHAVLTNVNNKYVNMGVLPHLPLHYDLVLYYKILHGHCDIVLSFASGSSVTRDNNFELAKQTCSIDVRHFFW